MPSDVLPDRDGIVAGAVAGAGAYLLGYVVTYVLVRPEVRESFGTSVPTWKVAAWYHFNAHFVDLIASQSVGAIEGATTLGLIAESGGTTTALYAVPPLTLLVAGAVAARWSDRTSPEGAAGVGLATTGGYGLLAVAVALLSVHGVSGSILGVDVAATLRVPLASVFVFAVVVYPVVFGTLGGVVGAAVTDRR